MTGRLESVNTGVAVDVAWGRIKRSAIDKRPATGRVRVRRLGLCGDEIADLKHHGGPDQAVYAYAREDLDAWAAELGRPLAPGSFGENLTTVGLDVQDARLGERWRIGSVLLEVVDVRIPCSVFQGFMDEPRWVRRFTQRGVAGAYLRVVSEGELGAADAIEVAERRDHDLTVGLAFRALTTEPDLLPALGAEPRVSTAIRRLIDSRDDPSEVTERRLG